MSELVNTIRFAAEQCMLYAPGEFVAWCIVAAAVVIATGAMCLVAAASWADDAAERMWNE